MTDIATLGIKIISDGIEKAKDGLNNLTKSGKEAEHQTLKLSKSYDELGTYVKRALGAFAGFQTAKYVLEATLASERMNSAMKATAGTALAAGKELQFIREESQRLGLEFRSTAEAYAKFSASTKNTTIEGESTRKVFTGVSEAVTALRLSGEQANGIFLALSQMMSKGKISAEELSGQLGERLPGAVKLTADAMGLTTQELLKQMQAGNLMSSDVLPKLAEQLHKTYGTAAIEAATGGQSAINRFKNSVFESASALGGALMPAFTGILGVLTPLMDYLKMFIGGIEILAVKLATLPDKAAAAWRVIKSGEGLFTDKGMAMYGKESANSNAAAEAAIADIMAKYIPTSSAKTSSEMAAEQAKVAAALAKESAGGDKNAEKAARATENWRKTYADLNTEISNLNPAMSEQAKKIADIDNKYADLMGKKGANIALLKQLHTEHVSAVTDAGNTADAIKNTANEFKNYLAAMESDDPQHNNAAAMSLRWESELKWLESIQPTAEIDALNEQMETLGKMLADMPELADKVAAGLGSIKSPALAAHTDYMINTAIAIQSANGDDYGAKQAAIEEDRKKEIEAIKATNAKKLLSNQEYLDALAAAEEKAAARKKQTAEEKSRNELNSLGSSLGQIGDLLAQGNKDQFEAGKAFAIASTIINTYMAASAAFAGITASTGGWGIAVASLAAGTAVATGLAQVAVIQSTQYEAREMGGPVTAGKPYIVGEKRAEVFVPNQSGRIIPSTGESQPVNVTQVYQISTGVADTVRSEIGRMVPALTAHAVNAVRSAMNQGQLQRA